MRRTTSLTTAVLAGLAPVLVQLPTAPAAGAGETCRGEAATLVGTSDTEPLVGTEGRDVIVTGKADEVRAGGGDDLICVAAPGQVSTTEDVDAGAGDDVVDTTALRAHHYIDVVLGTGSDAFVGGAADDWVVAGADGALREDDETDQVTTGAGRDDVRTGSRSTPNGDLVDTGTGGDSIDLGSSALAPGAVITGGPDLDSLYATVVGDAAFDMAAGTFTTPAGTAHFTSVERLSLDAGAGNVSYRGTEDDDQLMLTTGPGAPTLDVSSLGGDDEVLVAPAQLAAGSRIDTGAGTDELVTGRLTSALAIDLARGRLQVDAVTVAVGGLEDAFLLAREVSLVGDGRANELTYASCDATVRGAGGNDDIGSEYDVHWETYNPTCRSKRAVLSGGPGADELRGFGGNDRLSGGAGDDRVLGRAGRDLLRGGPGNDIIKGDPGRDRASGDQGSDFCVAERERGCER